MPANRTRKDRLTVLSPLKLASAKASADRRGFAHSSDIDGSTVLAGAGREVFMMMPVIRDIPDTFFGAASSDAWVAIQAAWQSRGIMDWGLRPKPGVNEDHAIRHIMAVQRLLGLPNGYKAAVAYMMSLWFKEPAL